MYILVRRGEQRITIFLPEWRWNGGRNDKKKGQELSRETEHLRGKRE